MTTGKKFNRREFIGSAAIASVGFSIVPRSVLGGPGFIAPSDKLTLAYIGCGTQGLREMSTLIPDPRVQIVAVCDPNKMSTNYVDWSPHSIRDSIRKALGDPNWGANINGIPGGRDIGKELVDKYYTKNAGNTYKGCTAYNDFRDLLEKEKGIDAVKIMTPDHQHATIAIAAMKKGKHVAVHKPIANRIHEYRVARDTASKMGVSTHLLAWSRRPGNDIVKKWIADGAIGTLKEIHNWSNRPMWPQWTEIPTDTPSVPDGFDWKLWLGPVPDRPYSPEYTFAVFRGWYDFGGGSIADMGHYSLFPLFQILGVNTPPTSAEAHGTTTCKIVDQVSIGVKNNVAFPYSCTIRFKFPKQETLPPFDLFWYDGGMRPPTPDELLEDGKELGREGMMFVGDKGKILAEFRCENPRLIPASRMTSYMNGQELPPEQDNEQNGTDVWIESFLNKKESPGSFQNAYAVTETIQLGAVALRAGKRVEYDATNMKITNDADSDKLLYREYRPGWEL